MTKEQQQRERFLRFKERLQIPHYQAVGIIEILRHVAAPGRTATPESLAEAMEWDGGVDALYTALLECGYLNVVKVPRNN